MGLFQSLLLAAMLFGVGCVVQQVQPDQAAEQPDLEDMSVENDASAGPPTASGGNLPLGFNELGCQWDACEPAPASQDTKTNPVR